MAAEKTRGIILRVVEFSETSCVVTLFTEDFGKVGALAKGRGGPKGPFEGAIDLLAPVPYSPAPQIVRYPRPVDRSQAGTAFSLAASGTLRGCMPDITWRSCSRNLPSKATRTVSLFQAGGCDARGFGQPTRACRKRCCCFELTARSKRAFALAGAMRRLRPDRGRRKTNRLRHDIRRSALRGLPAGPAGSGQRESGVIEAMRKASELVTDTRWANQQWPALSRRSRRSMANCGR